MADKKAERQPEPVQPEPQETPEPQVVDDGTNPVGDDAEAKEGQFLARGQTAAPNTDGE
jgi:hypothetical protein